ncbi:MAG TPA: AIR synthase related protein, partial [Trueperaceae bacterium]|nr:AIR synthase related protein [Trueperaceae bacterium]
AAVLRVKGTDLGVGATVDCNSRYVWLSPRLGAAHAVAEAARNLSCVGAEPLGVTDNLNFGNPTDPAVYHQLSEAVQGVREACIALGTPVTGGNVSLYNQYVDGAVARAVHPTPTIGMVGVLRDVTRRATQGLKREGDTLFLLGSGLPTLGASEFLFRLHGLEAGSPPDLDLAAEAALQRAVRRLVTEGLCDTAHDVSVGGLVTCLAEMALTGQTGLSTRVAPVQGGPLGRDVALFGESSARAVVAVSADAGRAVVQTCGAEGVPVTQLGTSGGTRFRVVVDGFEEDAVDLPLDQMLTAWSATFESALG